MGQSTRSPGGANRGAGADLGSSRRLGFSDREAERWAGKRRQIRERCLAGLAARGIERSRGRSTVHQQVLSRDEACAFTRQKKGGPRDVFRLSLARQRLEAGKLSVDDALAAQRG